MPVLSPTQIIAADIRPDDILTLDGFCATVTQTKRGSTWMNLQVTYPGSDTSAGERLLLEAPVTVQRLTQTEDEKRAEGERWMRRGLENMLVKYAELTQTFLAEVAKDPTYAIDWKGDDMIAAQETALLARRVLHLVNIDGLTLSDAAATVRADVTKDIFSNVRGGSRSSSSIRNAIDDVRQAARVRFVENHYCM